MTTEPDLSTPGNPACSRCSHVFSAHEAGGAFACLADAGDEPCPCPGFAHEFNGTLRYAADYRPPDPEQATQVGLEQIAATEAALAGDWHRLTEIYAGSDNPPESHAIAGAVQCAWILQRLADDPVAVLARLRSHILAGGEP